MKKKQLCIDINSIVSLFTRGYLTGIGRTTLELIEALAPMQDKISFDITLYSQNMKGLGAKKIATPFRSKHLYFPYRPKYNKLLQLTPIKECLTGYDLIHIPHNFEYVHCPEKTIVTLHDALFMKMSEKVFEHEQMREIVPPFARKCKAIITCSESSRKDIIETMSVNPDKIHVIPWGVKYDLFYPEPDLEKAKQWLAEKWGITSPYFLSVSCNDERKNTPRLIDAYIELSKKNPENDLCLVWNPPKYIMEHVEKAGLQSRIHFLSGVSDVELRLLYSVATATVMPSIYEGFGLPVLESMACGTPVISSNTSSLPEVGGDVAIYIDPFDMHSIENALASFENKQYESTDLSQRCIARAAMFTWEKCARETVAVYEKYLKEE